MARPLQVGDTVIVVRGHKCFIDQFAGSIYKITRFVQPGVNGWMCSLCGGDDDCPIEPAAIGLESADGPVGVLVSWIDRLDPECVESEEKLEVCA